MGFNLAFKGLIHLALSHPYGYEYNKKDALYRLIYYSKPALHVSGDVFAQHQEHLTVFAVSDSVHTSCCRLPAGSNLGEHYQIM
jgi:hypothetical protein